MLTRSSDSRKSLFRGDVMFRFWCSNFSSDYRWREVEASTCEGLITKYHREFLWTNDCDNDGEDEVIFGIKAPGEHARFFKLKYEWIGVREEEEYWVDNPFWIEELTGDAVKDVPGDRDWIVIRKSYGCRCCGR
jgi:hypothetical protein